MRFYVPNVILPLLSHFLGVAFYTMNGSNGMASGVGVDLYVFEMNISAMLLADREMLVDLNNNIFDGERTITE